MKNKRSLWVSLISVIAITVITLSATLAAGWSPKLGLDLDGGLAVVYKTAHPVTKAELDTIVTILGERVNAGTSGASVESQGSDQISVSIPGEKNAQQELATLGKTAQLFFRPGLCYAPPLKVAKGQAPSTGPLPACAAASQLPRPTSRSRRTPTARRGTPRTTTFSPTPSSRPTRTRRRRRTSRTPPSCCRAPRPVAARSATSSDRPE